MCTVNYVHHLPNWASGLNKVRWQWALNGILPYASGLGITRHQHSGRISSWDPNLTCAHHIFFFITAYSITRYLRFKVNYMHFDCISDDRKQELITTAWKTAAKYIRSNRIIGLLPLERTSARGSRGTLPFSAGARAGTEQNIFTQITYPTAPALFVQHSVSSSSDVVVAHEATKKQHFCTPYESSSHHFILMPLCFILSYVSGHYNHEQLDWVHYRRNGLHGPELWSSLWGSPLTHSRVSWSWLC